MGLFTNATQNSRLLGYRVSTSISGTAIPLLFGTNRIPGNVIWNGDWQATSASGKANKAKYGGGTLNYTNAGIVALCSGPIQSIISVWGNQTQNGQTTTFLNATSLASLGLSSFTGSLGQAAWSYVSTNHPDQALGYSQIAYVADANWNLGSSGTMPNYSYEIAGRNLFGSGIVDALCSDVIYALLTDPYIGAGFATSEVDVSETDAFCRANSIFISPVLDQQKAASEWLNQLLLVANAEGVWSEGVLKLRSRGDTAASGNGATFTPNTTPVYDLNDDDFKDREEPVRINRPDPRDAPNSVKLNWTNRGNQYNTEPVEESDQYMIETYGLRPATSIDALGITTAPVAAKVANTQLKRGIYFRTRYKFKLGWEHILLEPMDIVTLTCQANGVTYQGLDHKPVRLLSIEEDGDGYLSCEAEECPLGAGNPTLNPKQVTGGFSPPLNADPGSVNTPVFYEAAPAMKQTLGVPYALLIAVSGGPYWGGCTVHRSFDGTTYDSIGRVVGPTTMGALTANFASHADPDATDTLSVSLLESFASLATVTLADADNFKTLFLVGSELMSFETATLTGTYAYNLTYLRRGVYGSSIAAHSSGDSFAVLDKKAFEWDYQAQDLGKTIYFKFTSFNQYGAAEQSMADATAYTFTLAGGLSAVKTVSSNYTVQPGDTAINVDASAGPVTITLPAASTTPNTNPVITKIDSSANAVTISGATVSGLSSLTLSTQYAFASISSTPSGWVQIGKTTVAINYADFETPSGALNGTNQTFTLAHPPSPAGSLQLYLNGDLQLSGIDYTLSGSTVTLLVAHPNTAQGDWLRASYRY